VRPISKGTLLNVYTSLPSAHQTLPDTSCLCYQANGAACTKDSQCMGSSTCDASAGCTGPNLKTSCSPSTGLDSVQCYGRCTDFCSVPAVVKETALYNHGETSRVMLVIVEI